MTARSCCAPWSARSSSPSTPPTAPRGRRDLPGRAAPAASSPSAQQPRPRDAGAWPRTPIELIRRLAEHHPDRQIAAILYTPGHTGPAPACRSPKRACAAPASAPASPPPRRPTPTSELVTIQQAAAELGVSASTRSAAGSTTGCCPASRPRPHAPLADPPDRRDPRPLRARHPRRVRRRSPRPPRRSAAPARPCCTRSNAASCTRSRSPAAAAKGSRIEVPAAGLDRLINDVTQEVQCEPGSGGPERTMFSLRVQEVELAEVLDQRSS